MFDIELNESLKTHEHLFYRLHSDRLFCRWMWELGVLAALAFHNSLLYPNSPQGTTNLQGTAGISRCKLLHSLYSVSGKSYALLSCFKGQNILNYHMNNSVWLVLCTQSIKLNWNFVFVFFRIFYKTGLKIFGKNIEKKYFLYFLVLV